MNKTINSETRTFMMAGITEDGEPHDLTIPESINQNAPIITILGIISCNEFERKTSYATVIIGYEENNTFYSYTLKKKNGQFTIQGYTKEYK